MSWRSFVRGTSLVGVCRREEEPAALLVGEELDRDQREPVRLEQPAKLAGRDMQLEQAVRDVCVVVQVPAATCPSVTARAQEPSVLRKRPEQELANAAGNLEPVFAFEAVRGLGDRRQREPVPRCEGFVVAEGLRAGRTLGEQALSERRVELPAHDEAAMLEGLEQLVGDP